MYPKGSISYHRDTCLAIFIARLFTIAKLENQSIVPSTDEWMNYVVHTYNGILFGHKKNGALTCAGKWIGLEIIRVS